MKTFDIPCHFVFFESTSNASSDQSTTDSQAPSWHSICGAWALGDRSMDPSSKFVGSPQIPQPKKGQGINNSSENLSIFEVSGLSWGKILGYMFLFASNLSGLDQSTSGQPPSAAVEWRSAWQTAWPLLVPHGKFGCKEYLWSINALKQRCSSLIPNIKG